MNPGQFGQKRGKTGQSALILSSYERSTPAQRTGTQDHRLTRSMAMARLVNSS